MIAVLLKPSGKVVERVEVEELPRELAHNGELWTYSHKTELGAAYQLARTPEGRRDE